MLDRFTIVRSVDCRHSNHEPNKVFQTANLAADKACLASLETEDPLAHTVLQTQLEHTDKMTGNWPLANDAQIKDAFWPEIQNAVLGRKDGKTALADAERGVKRVLRRS